MEVSPHKYQFALTQDDLRSIREAILRWGKPAECIDGFTGAELCRHFERWKEFVDTDWADRDFSEYEYGIGCRFWIQVSIERSSPATRAVLEQQVAPIDAQFQSRMRRVNRPHILDSAPLSRHPYFWESHSIHLKRHGLLTAFLIFKIVGYVALFLINAFAAAGVLRIAPNLPKWIPSVFCISSILGVVSVVAILRWMKWGFYVLCGMEVAALVVNVYARVSPIRILFGLTGLLILYLLLQLGGERNAWSRLR
jgi:hypothetical protein